MKRHFGLGLAIFVSFSLGSCMGNSLPGNDETSSIQDSQAVPTASVPQTMEDRATVDGASTVFMLMVPDSLFRDDGVPTIQFKFNSLYLYSATADNTAVGSSFYQLASTSDEAKQYCSFNENAMMIEIRIPTAQLKAYYGQLLKVNGPDYTNINLFVGMEEIFDSGVHRTVMVTDLYVTPEVAGLA